MIFIYREGSHAPHGPFQTEPEARAYAREEEKRWPGYPIVLLAVIDRLSSAPTAEATWGSAVWDAGEEFRPLAPGYAALLRDQQREAGLSIANSDVTNKTRQSLGFLRKIIEPKNTPQNKDSQAYATAPEHPLSICLGAITGLLSGEEVPTEFPEQFARLTRLKAALLAAEPEQPLTLAREDRQTLVRTLEGLLPALSRRAETVEELLGLGLVAQALEWVRAGQEFAVTNTRVSNATANHSPDDQVADASKVIITPALEVQS